jgi:SAM-dependent methyltransferase
VNDLTRNRRGVGYVWAVANQRPYLADTLSSDERTLAESESQNHNLSKRAVEHETIWRNVGFRWAVRTIDGFNSDLSRRDWLTELIAMDPNSVFEVGCSFGPNLFILQNELPNLKVYGIDISEDAISTGRKELGLDCIGLGSAYDIPHPDRAFDLVFTSGVLQHLPFPDVVQALNELGRVSNRFIAFLESGGGIGESAPLTYSTEFRIYDHSWFKMIESLSVYELTKAFTNKVDYMGYILGRVDRPSIHLNQFSFAAFRF